MCIVSIFSKDNGDFILTHNRDESILRPTSDKVEEQTIHNKQYTGPKDLLSGGTWIYYSDEYVCCILNGGYEKHQHRPPYRMSRGLIILELLKYSSIDEFIEETELDGIEPFTMIMINRKTTEKKILVWDEKMRHKEDLSEESLIIRSSSPLYSKEEKNKHYRAFIELVNSDNPKQIFKLHDKLKMPANQKFPTVQTTSITQVIQRNSEIELNFCPIHT